MLQFLFQVKCKSSYFNCVNKNETAHNRQLSLAEASVSDGIATALLSTSQNQKQQRNAKSQAGQLVTTASLISSEERPLLEAMEFQIQFSQEDTYIKKGKKMIF